MGRRHKSKPKTYELTITALSHEGRGIARFDDKVIFVRGALIGEIVLAKRTLARAKFEEADTLEVLQSSADRIAPKCAVFGVCGGCSLQYLTPEKQISFKNAWLQEILFQQTKIQPKDWMLPMMDAPWGYRNKARLGVRYVEKKDKVLVGFRQRGSGFITEMDRCEILHPRVGAQLGALGKWLAKLNIKRCIPQIEVAIGGEIVVLILRHLEPLLADDREILTQCALALDVVFYTQSAGVASIQPLDLAAKLQYAHADHDLVIEFSPNDFTQINAPMNARLVTRALELLDVQSTDNVLDLFCGLGNFTLAIARYACSVVGVEGDFGLIERAQANARRNGIENARFYQADLFDSVEALPWFAGQTYNKALIDPARTGAIEVLEHLPALGAERLVYVSCNPATLARDAQRLLALGFEMERAGVVDMFPHTQHVEAIVLFVKSGQASGKHLRETRRAGDSD